MEKVVKLAFVGLGGYAEQYLKDLLSDEKRDKDVELCAGIDPFPEKCLHLEELKKRGMPLFRDIDEYLAGDAMADLVVASSPIQFHGIHMCRSMENGCNVLCEKPLCATVSEADRIIETRDRSRKFAAVGYQWSYSEAIQELKNDIQSGLLGKPLRFRTLGLWPRTEVYYGRNAWAGKLKDGEGRWVLDSPVNNALAHYLHNMFFVLGESFDSSAEPETVCGELYRVKPLENFDSAGLRVFTGGGVELLFYVTHACREMKGPVIIYEFKNAVVTADGPSSDFKAVFRDGTEKVYGNPSRPLMKKMWDCIKSVRTGEPVACPPEAAKPHTVTVNALYKSFPRILDVPSSLTKSKGEEGEKLVYSEEMEEALVKSFEQGCLPSELGIEWCRPGNTVDVREYDSFE